MWIAWTSGIVIAAIWLAAWWMPSFVDHTLPFGVRVPPDRVADPEVAATRERYRWRVALCGAVAVAATVVLGARTGEADAFVVLTFALPLTLVGAYALYYQAHRRLRNVKLAGRWYDGWRQGAVAELTPYATRALRLWPWFMPALALVLATLWIGIARYPHLPALIPMHANAAGQVDRYARKSIGAAFSPVWIQFALTTALLAAAAITGRQHGHLDPHAPEASVKRQRRLRGRMSWLLGVVAGLVNALLLVAAGWTWGIWGLRTVEAATSIFLIAILAASGLAILQPRRPGSPDPGIAGGRAVASGLTDVAQRDDDRFWHGGAVYINRDDSSLFVPKRFGVGWTVNFGHPGAWVFVAALLLVIVIPLVLAR